MDTRIALLLLAAGCGGSHPVSPDDAGPIVFDATPPPDGGPPAADAGPPATCPEGFPLDDVSGKPVFTVTVDGRGPYRFVYDSGSPGSAVESTILSDIAAGMHSITFGGQTVDVRLEPLPLRDGLRSPDVDGLLGGDALGDFALTLDVARRVFWVDPVRDEAALRACAHVAGDPAEVEYVPWGFLYVPGRIEDEEGWLLVDTGASLGAVPDGVFDAIDAAHPRPVLRGFYTPAFVGTFWARLGVVGSIEVGGRRVEHLLVRTLTDGLLEEAPGTGRILGVLPTGYLAHFLVTIDYPAQVLRLDAYRDDTLREDSRIFTTGISLEETLETQTLVRDVLPGSAAEEAGILAGDEILAASGRNFTALDPYSRPWALVSRLPGDTVSVEVRHGDTTRSVMLETRDLLVDPPR